jgi:hypothetical protein
MNLAHRKFFIKSFQDKIFYFFVILALSSCTFFGGAKKDKGISQFITGAISLDKVKDVHIVNMMRAIGAPNNSVVVGGYRYYQWHHSGTVGVNTLLGGGSTTLYCSLTTETQSNKIKIINWYGNQCSLFLDPIGEYFEDKLNIAVITDESDKKQNMAASAAEGNSGQKNSETGNKPVIDLRQKTPEQKSIEQKTLEQKTQEQNAINETKTSSTDSVNLKQNDIVAIDSKQ